MNHLRWSRWRTLTKVFTLIWIALVVGALLAHDWTALFYYTIFLCFQVVVAAQDALIAEQRETINELRRWWL